MQDFNKELYFKELRRVLENIKLIHLARMDKWGRTKPFFNSWDRVYSDKRKKAVYRTKLHGSHKMSTSDKQNVLDLVALYSTKLVATIEKTSYMNYYGGRNGCTTESVIIRPIINKFKKS